MDLTEKKMEQTIASLQEKLITIRAGRANPRCLME